MLPLLGSRLRYPVLKGSSRELINVVFEQKRVTRVPNRFARVFVTGGAGYICSVLIPKLLGLISRVTSYDISYYGDNFLPKSNPNLQVIRGDIRDTAKLAEAVAG